MFPVQLKILIVKRFIFVERNLRKLLGGRIIGMIQDICRGITARGLTGTKRLIGKGGNSTCNEFILYLITPNLLNRIVRRIQFGLVPDMNL